jgi:hypothetical protein
MKNKITERWLVAGGALALIIGLSIWGVSTSRKTVTPAVVTNPADLPGMQTTPAPWPAEISSLRDRLTDIGLPALSEEGSALHIHQHLDILIDGKPVVVPAGIGIQEAMGFISPIHTHDTSGVIHVESPTVQTFTLGQFFDIWGLKFTNDSIGGYSNTADKTLKVFINGAPYTGDFRSIALAAHQEIVVAYGTLKELPNPIPVSFAFPAGE